MIMKKKIDKIITKTTKLEKKIIIYITCFILILAVSFSTWFIFSEKKTLIVRDTQNIIYVSKKLANEYNMLFEDLFNTAESLNYSIAKRVVSTNNIQPFVFNLQKIKRSNDGSIRIDDEDSGAFLPKSSKLNDKLRKTIFFSKRAFELISQIAKTHFFNYYFITKENFIRITPKDWALQIEADHKFDNDIFYKIAVPENNPDKKAKWTPLYYDSIWEKWMTSLIIPVYDNNEFIGVTGSDIFLDELFEKIMNLKNENSLYQVVLFDSHGNLLADPEYKDEILKKTSKMNSLLNINDLNDSLLSKIIAQTIKRSDFSDKISIIEENSETYYYSSQKISGVDWYLCVYLSRANILKSFNFYIYKIMGASVILGLIIILAVYLYFKKLILKRISTLGSAISNITLGDFNSKIEIKNNDEIGILENGFNNMQQSITNQFRELEEHRDHLEELVGKRTGEVKKELAQRKEIEKELRKHRDNLQNLVDVRTAEVKKELAARKQAEENLKKQHEYLEELVKERTEELEDKNKELDNMLKVFVGRELTIKKLQERIRLLGGR